VAGTGSLDLAASAMAVGVMANTALKLGVALFFGTAAYRLIAGGGLALMIAAAAVPLIWPFA
jgi:hypothetical protein